jgi:hypothetical protein
MFMSAPVSAAPVRRGCNSPDLLGSVKRRGVDQSGMGFRTELETPGSRLWLRLVAHRFNEAKGSIADGLYA